MGKRNSGSSSGSAYLNSGKRIKNKTRKLNKFIKKLEKARKESHINKNTNRKSERGSIETIIKSCRIGRRAEGFKPEDFKCLPQKKNKTIAEKKDVKEHSKS